MASIPDVMAYFCERYPYKSELSKARLTKMIYLADWRMALVSGRQITSLTWVFNHYGPYLDDVPNIARTDSRFELKSEANMYGSLKEVIALKEPVATPSINADEKAALDHVIEKTKSLTWQPFIKLVYSTYPIATQPRYEQLDLVALAARYQQARSAIPTA